MLLTRGDIMDKLESIRRRQRQDAQKKKKDTSKANTSVRSGTRSTASKTVSHTSSSSGRTTSARTASGTTASSGRTPLSRSTATMQKTSTLYKNGDTDRIPRASGSRRAPSSRSKSSKKLKDLKAKSLIKIMVVLFVLGIIGMSGMIVWATWGMDFDFDDSFSKLGMNLSSVVYYEDDDGNLKYYERLIADQNRMWVDGEKVPQYMKDAFVSIEDQRFYRHGGVDIKRTMGAVLNVVFKGDSSYGGSTITQQLVKNITADSERSKARKIREMVRAVIIESKMDKEQILELYMNSIYLGHGANGVQAAAKVYFDKDVSELTLVECAAIAGVTKYPATYDPIANPEGNKQRRQLVLDKMYELEYITEQEYTDASSKELNIVGGEITTQSYFVDYLYEELLADLMATKGYTQAYATDLIYNGGLKIVATVDPEIQDIMDKVYAQGKGFPKFYGSAPQSAMVITDPTNGQIKGIVGGTGKKQGARVLNRASQTRRQPGSTIKPIAVYAPAIDTGTITLASYIQNSPLVLGQWQPKNANNKFTEPVSVRTAVASSLNLPAIRVLEEITVDTSFEYMTEKLHINLVDSKREGTKVLSDKALAPLSLGGLTDGVTVMEMNSAYSTFANGGEYVAPSSYTKVYDASGEILIQKVPSRNTAFSEETAFVMTELLKGVMQYGTAAGYSISGIETCGKTGSTDDNMDRWFAGFTPYYCGTVWVGYDEQKVISYGGLNPALTIWKNIMSEVHKNYKSKSFEAPVGIDKVYTCISTGQFATSACSGVTDYVNTRLMKGYCNGDHSNVIGTPGVLPEEEEQENPDEQQEGEVTDDENNSGVQSGISSGEEATVEPQSPEATVVPKPDNEAAQ